MLIGEKNERSYPRVFYAFWFIVLLFIVSFMLMLVGLVAFHTKGMLSNVTTIEYFQGEELLCCCKKM